MKPNIVLVMADQFRFDAIGAHGNPYVSTPTFNQWVKNGTDFVETYSATPTCIPARAQLMSGMSQSSTGIVGYQEGANWNFPNRLGQAFADRGYYAKAIGKMHVSPPRNRMGFHSVELHDGYMHVQRNTSLDVNESYLYTDDYLKWAKDEMGADFDLIDLGLECNSWVARPFSYPERVHPTNWLTSRAVDFLRTRDTREPFFLKMSYVRPHSPLDPPEYYFNMYMDSLREVEREELSKWCEKLGLVHEVSRIDAYDGELPIDDYRRMLAGYFGLVTHLDHQLNRFMLAMREHNLLDNTIFVFTSDHGDQLGEHNLYRKGYPYQGSMHIPLLVYDPGENIMPAKDRKSVVKEIIELRDILPSLVDFGTGEKLLRTDGKSFKKLMLKDADNSDWRKYLHGEHVLGNYSNQSIIKLPWKYIWYSQTGEEQLFNIDQDPEERSDLIADDQYKSLVDELRQILIAELKDREEGFVVDDQLVSGRPQEALLEKNKEFTKEF